MRLTAFSAVMDFLIAFAVAGLAGLGTAVLVSTTYAFIGSLRLTRA